MKAARDTGILSIVVLENVVDADGRDFCSARTAPRSADPGETPNLTQPGQSVERQGSMLNHCAAYCAVVLFIDLLRLP